jgi:hypothetical protein
MAVGLFKSRLAGLKGGTPDECRRFLEEIVPRMLRKMALSSVKKGEAKDPKEEEKSTTKGNGNKQGGGKVGKVKRSEADASIGEEADSDKQVEKKTPVRKSEDPCLSHLGHLMGVYSRECRFGEASCCFTHKGVAEVSKALALSCLAGSKIIPEKIRESFKKEIEDKLV